MLGFDECIHYAGLEGGFCIDHSVKCGSLKDCICELRPDSGCDDFEKVNNIIQTIKKNKRYADKISDNGFNHLDNDDPDGDSIVHSLAGD